GRPALGGLTWGSSRAGCLEHEGVAERHFLQTREASCCAAMAGIKIDLEQDGLRTGGVVTQTSHPLCWFPIGHAWVGQAGQSEDRRVGLRLHIIVGRI